MYPCPLCSILDGIQSNNRPSQLFPLDGLTFRDAFRVKFGTFTRAQAVANYFYSSRLEHAPRHHVTLAAHENGSSEVWQWPKADEWCVKIAKTVWNVGKCGARSWHWNAGRWEHKLRGKSSSGGRPAHGSLRARGVLALTSGFRIEWFYDARVMTSRE